MEVLEDDDEIIVIPPLGTFQTNACVDPVDQVSWGYSPGGTNLVLDEPANVKDTIVKLTKEFVDIVCQGGFEGTRSSHDKDQMYKMIMKENQHRHKWDTDASYRWRYAQRGAFREWSGAVLFHPDGTPWAWTPRGKGDKPPPESMPAVFPEGGSRREV